MPGESNEQADNFRAHLVQLTGLSDNAPECVLTFFGATIFPQREPPMMPWKADAELAAWIFNNHSVEALDGAFRLLSRHKYINHFGNKWVDAVKNDRRFSQVSILHPREE